MLNYIKNDFISTGEKVECYYSKVKDLISIKKLDTHSDNFNRIVAHTKVIHLENCEIINRGNRTILRGNFVGTLNVVPNGENLIHESEGVFYTLTGEKINAARYCVAYLNMILAEGCYYNEGALKRYDKI